MAKIAHFIEEFLPAEFWSPDDLHPEGYGLPSIERSTLRKFLREVYDARSLFAHDGVPFPAHVEIGIFDRLSARASLQAMALVNSNRFVPLFIWFERLTHLILVEYLSRVIAPELNEKRQRRAEEKTSLLEEVRNLPDQVRESLERLTRWTTQFVGVAVINPMAPNREWALDEPSIEVLLSAGLSDGDSSMDGRSWIKDREVGEFVGEYFFGVDHNPLKGNTILHPRQKLDPK